MNPIRVLLVFLAAAAGLGAGAAVLAPVAEQVSRSFLERRPIEELPRLSMPEAIRVQGMVVVRLSHVLGPVVGYKAALTNPAAQARFGVHEPIRGTLLEQMLRPDGATVTLEPGLEMLAEADLLVRVGSEKIHVAQSDAELLAGLAEVIPFLELPDRVFAPTIQVDGPSLVAANAGARLGIIGRPIPLSGARDWPERLASFRAELCDGDGKVLATGRGRDLLGHPLNVVRFLRDSVRIEKRGLKTGDLLSLGSVAPMVPVQTGGVRRVRYIGLDPAGPVEIAVTIRTK